MTENIDHQEVNKFAELADEWWNKNGDLTTACYQSFKSQLH